MPVEDVIKRIYDLPSIPQIVQELIANFNSASANAETISRRIQSDPVIAAKVLRLANSVRYGAGRRVASLDSAVVILGIDTLRTLVIASGVTSAVKNIPGMDMRRFWRDSFMVANVSKIIARNAAGCDPEVAFTCGMLHKIGLPLMYLVKTETMKIIESMVANGNSQINAENAKLGYNHSEVGARLAASWKFPEIISDALAHQQKPLQASPFSPYAAIVFLASTIAERLNDDVDSKAIISALPEKLTSALTLNSLGLFEQLERFRETEDDIDEMLAA
ncbi:MAG: signal transduction protein [Pseudomonadales bacterium]|nr:signal transduction protein [Pseudomonadales bacterium]